MIFRLTLPSTTRSIGRVEGFLAKVNKSNSLDEIQMNKVMISLTEAVNNAIIHGNKSNPAKKVRLACEIHPGGMMFIVRDEGRGFNPDKVKNPLKKENLMKESGRGIFLMRTLMDKVEFHHGAEGSRVDLWLDLNKSAIFSLT
jgi:serine/threonine-protein kinase RsbW